MTEVTTNAVRPITAKMAKDPKDAKRRQKAFLLKLFMLHVHKIKVETQIALLLGLFA